MKFEMNKLLIFRFNCDLVPSILVQHNNGPGDEFPALEESAIADPPTPTPHRFRQPSESFVTNFFLSLFH